MESIYNPDLVKIIDLGELVQILNTPDFYLLRIQFLEIELSIDEQKALLLRLENIGLNILRARTAEDVEKEIDEKNYYLRSKAQIGVERNDDLPF